MEQKQAQQVIADEKAEAQRRLELNIRWLADVWGFPLRRLAGLAGVSRQSLNNWLTGEASLTLDHLQSLADSLGVEASDLLMRPTDLAKKIEKEGLKEIKIQTPSVAKIRAISSANKASGKRKTGKKDETCPYPHTRRDVRKRTSGRHLTTV